MWPYKRKRKSGFFLPWQWSFSRATKLLCAIMFDSRGVSRAWCCGPIVAWFVFSTKFMKATSSDKCVYSSMKYLDDNSSQRWGELFHVDYTLMDDMSNVYALFSRQETYDEKRQLEYGGQAKTHNLTHTSEDQQMLIIWKFYFSLTRSEKSFRLLMVWNLCSNWVKHLKMSP